jgi:hypothetical protein
VTYRVNVIKMSGVWSKLSRRASNIDRNVVALASFNGDLQ